MATNPEPDPIEEEVRELLEAEPDLAEQLRRMGQQMQDGKARLTPNDEVARRFGLEDELESG